MSKMLSSWKEIAHFFGKGVRTVQRWEKTLDLPIRRPPGAPSNVVLARTSDLEEWMHRSSAIQAAANGLEGSNEQQQDPLKAAIVELDNEVEKLIEMQSGKHSTEGYHASVKGDPIAIVRSLTEKVRGLNQHEDHHELKKVA